MSKKLRLKVLLLNTVKATSQSIILNNGRRVNSTDRIVTSENYIDCRPNSCCNKRGSDLCLCRCGRDNMMVRRVFDNITGVFFCDREYVTLEEEEI